MYHLDESLTLLQSFKVTNFIIPVQTKIPFFKTVRIYKRTFWDKSLEAN